RTPRRPRRGSPADARAGIADRYFETRCLRESREPSRRDRRSDAGLRADGRRRSGAPRSEAGAERGIRPSPGAWRPCAEARRADGPTLREKAARAPESPTGALHRELPARRPGATGGPPTPGFATRPARPAPAARGAHRRDLTE